MKIYYSPIILLILILSGIKGVEEFGLPFAVGFSVGGLTMMIIASWIYGRSNYVRHH